MHVPTRDIFIVHMMEGSSVVPVDSTPTHVSYNTMVTEWENFQNWAIQPVNSKEGFVLGDNEALLQLIRKQVFDKNNVLHYIASLHLDNV